MVMSVWHYLLTHLIEGDYQHSIPLSISEIPMNISVMLPFFKGGITLKQ